MLSFVCLLYFFYAALCFRLFYPALDSFTYQTLIECLGTRLDTGETKLTKSQSYPEGSHSPVGEREMS